MRGYFIPHFSRAKVSILLSVVALVTLLGALVATGAFRVPTSQAQSPGNWSTFQFNNARTGFNASETIINPTSASHLKLHWKRTITATISSEPIVANGMLYWGSWDGKEHASSLTDGRDIWATNLGTSVVPCDHKRFGVTGAATIATVGVSGAVGLVAGQGNVQDVEADATPRAAAVAAGAAITAVAGVAFSAAHHEHGHDDTTREQLDVLAVDFSEA